MPLHNLLRCRPDVGVTSLLPKREWIFLSPKIRGRPTLDEEALGEEVGLEVMAVEAVAEVRLVTLEVDLRDRLGSLLKIHHGHRQRLIQVEGDRITAPPDLLQVIRGAVEEDLTIQILHRTRRGYKGRGWKIQSERGPIRSTSKRCLRWRTSGHGSSLSGTR